MILFGFGKDCSQHNYWNSCTVDNNRHYRLFCKVDHPDITVNGWPYPVSNYSLYLAMADRKVSIIVMSTGEV